MPYESIPQYLCGNVECKKYLQGTHIERPYSETVYGWVSYDEHGELLETEAGDSDNYEEEERETRCQFCSKYNIIDLGTDKEKRKDDYIKELRSFGVSEEEIVARLL